MLPSEREDRRYTAGFENPLDLEEDVMFDLLPPSPGSCLDIGCGVGNIALKIMEKGFTVQGIDFSPVAVQNSQSRGVNASVCDVDKSGLPFEDNRFDLIWAGDVVEHVFDPIGLLEEIRRVVKQSGRVLISVPNDIRLQTRIEIGIFGYSPQSKQYRRHRQCKHHSVISYELINFMLKKAGLKWRLEAGIFINPITRKKYVLRNPLLIRWLAHTLIISAKPVSK